MFSSAVLSVLSKKFFNCRETNIHALFVSEQQLSVGRQPTNQTNQARQIGSKLLRISGTDGQLLYPNMSSTTTNTCTTWKIMACVVHKQANSTGNLYLSNHLATPGLILHVQKRHSQQHLPEHKLAANRSGVESFVVVVVVFVVVVVVFVVFSGATTATVGANTKCGSEHFCDVQHGRSHCIQTLVVVEFVQVLADQTTQKSALNGRVAAAEERSRRLEQRRSDGTEATLGVRVDGSA